MKVSNLNGVATTYPNENIETISFPQAYEVFSPEDCAGNGISPNTTIINIAFKDGTSATFEARNWFITEV